MPRIRRMLQRYGERAVLAAGRLDAGGAGDWAESKRVVFVCTGNICRSPFAEALAAREGMLAVSCGTRTASNRPAHPLAVAEAARRRVDLSAHRSTRWEDVKLEATDTVVVAQLRHAFEVRARARAAGCRVVLMSALLLPDFEVVWDPYGDDEAPYVSAFDQIERAVARLVDLAGLRRDGRAACFG